MKTIKDIARAAGVSTSTVSKALNGYGDVGAQTAEKIRKIAQEMNYLPDAAARVLKTNRSYNIGIVFEDGTESGLTHEYFSHILNSAKNELENHGYDITFIGGKVGGNSFLSHCRYRKVDGVLIASVDFHNPQVVELVNSEIPTITIDYQFDSHSCVMSDNVQGAYDLVKYLVSMGHRRIAFIHGERTSVTIKRLSGFNKAAREFGLNIPAEYIRESRYHNIERTMKEAEEILALPNRPSVLMFPDDYTAIGCRPLFEKLGVRIPEDLSITGYDGIPLSQETRPCLTTEKQDAQAIGAKAAAKLVDLIENKDSQIVEQIVVEGTLLKGETVKRISTE
ncbi:MAG: LacI family DNA-binding transcriptional regulator [Galactobacillus timonensis]|uniref:LacI family DNA-binding transcriptional regulator n=2 Tax=Galactobacillus timonensis TaxID=2041840 RepID=UPI00240A35B2|nr:LacI family DNA-binding transcriptional regulator [Galactobacillus timonensis]MDD5851077.1 LacI family DNA-binding transcriptional regulator [Galactobacillus timonensis]MDD6681490.1 LacI family DNA-binding transcriptional regulator [Galactobacillus timonensis]